MKRKAKIKPVLYLSFDDGFKIPTSYNDIVCDMKYHYSTIVDWQLRLYYTFYEEALSRIYKLNYLSLWQHESLLDLNRKLYRERLQY